MTNIETLLLEYGEKLKKSYDQMQAVNEVKDKKVTDPTGYEYLESWTNNWLKQALTSFEKAVREDEREKINNSSVFLETDPNVVGGALVFKNSRLTADVILAYLGTGYTKKDLKKSYPQVEKYVDKLLSAKEEV